MNFCRFLFTSLFLCAVPSLAIAQEKSTSIEQIKVLDEVMPEPAPNESSPGSAISPLQKFQAAPFTGVLLSPLAVAKIITDLENREEETKIEIENAVRKAEATCSYEKTILENKIAADSLISAAQIEARNKEILALEKALEKELNDKQDPLVWGLIGLAAGVITTTATATIITYASR